MEGICAGQKTLINLMEELSSKLPAPGGGGASALIGAVGFSLCSMVANLTSGKKKYAQHQEELDRILSVSVLSVERLLKLIDKDAEVFEPLSKAYALPKDDPGRELILEEALVRACTVPTEILLEVSGAVDLLEQLLVKGTRIALSDVGVAASACRSAMEGAAMNVFCNTRLMQNRGQADKINAQAEAVLAAGVNRCEAVYEKITMELRGVQCKD